MESYTLHSPPTCADKAPILAIWQDCCTMQRCTFCGAPVDDDEGGLYNLDDMRDRRECRDHHTPF